MATQTATPLRVRRSFGVLGDHLTVARKLQRLTAAQVAERAHISLPTLRSLERGEGAATLETFLSVVRALGMLDRLETALDPYTTDVGRLRMNEQLPERVRQSSASQQHSGQKSLNEKSTSPKEANDV